jgi:hypothetical protein
MVVQKTEADFSLTELLASLNERLLFAVPKSTCLYMGIWEQLLTICQRAVFTNQSSMS